MPSGSPRQLALDLGQALREQASDEVFEELCTLPGWLTEGRDSAGEFVSQARRKGFALDLSGEGRVQGDRAAVPVVFFVKDKPRGMLWLLAFGAGAERWALEGVTRHEAEVDDFLAGRRGAMLAAPASAES